MAKTKISGLLLKVFQGLQPCYRYYCTYGVNAGRISLEKLVELTSYNASRIFGMHPKKDIFKGTGMLIW